MKTQIGSKFLVGYFIKSKVIPKGDNSKMLLMLKDRVIHHRQSAQMIYSQRRYYKRIIICNMTYGAAGSY